MSREYSKNQKRSVIFRNETMICTNSKATVFNIFIIDFHCICCLLSNENEIKILRPTGSRKQRPIITVQNLVVLDLLIVFNFSKNSSDN